MIGTERVLFGNPDTFSNMYLIQYYKPRKLYPSEEYPVPNIRLARLYRRDMRKNGHKQGTFKLISELTGESVQF